jgi:hypothetical protein
VCDLLLLLRFGGFGNRCLTIATGERRRLDDRLCDGDSGRSGLAGRGRYNDGLRFDGRANVRLHEPVIGDLGLDFMHAHFEKSLRPILEGQQEFLDYDDFFHDGFLC